MSTTRISFRALPSADAPQITFSVEAPGLDLPDVFDAPLTLNNAVLTEIDQYQSNPTLDTGVVRKVGGALFECLLTHGNAHQALARTVQAAMGSAGRQVRLQIHSFATRAQNIPWELLHDPEIGFLELCAGVPVIREVVPKYQALGPSGQLDADGLRILSVIAAHGVPGRGEWQAVKSALRGFRHRVSLEVLVSDKALRDEIAAEEIASTQSRAIDLVPASKPELLTAMRRFAPQVCHFFCHGRPISGGYLEIATNGMEFGGNPHTLMAADLEDVLPGTAWLVLLNACSGAGADPAGGTSSLAARLVRQGVPIVVGMREEVPSDIVGRFTKVFLSDALSQISDILDGAAAAELDLGQCLTRARASICDDFPGLPALPTSEIGARVKEWALPVMSVGTSAFCLVPKPTFDPLKLAELTSELENLKRAKALVGASLTEAQAAQIDARIAAVEAKIAGILDGAGP